ncbi:hypothetical protein A2U01_0070295, partial [Trifolium medium]|nr:hypothetical protein [Trifolium medium]
ILYAFLLLLLLPIVSLQLFSFPDTVCFPAAAFFFSVPAAVFLAVSSVLVFCRF